jgi:predicted DNA binding CopG/RHH family protein
MRKKPEADNAAAEAFVEAAPDAGTKKPAKKKQPVTMLYPVELLEQIDKCAARRHMTRTTYVQQVLREEIERVASQS